MNKERNYFIFTLLVRDDTLGYHANKLYTYFMRNMFAKNQVLETTGLENSLIFAAFVYS